MRENKENKERTNLTLAPEIKKKADRCSEELGMSMSAFISMLIANYKR